MASSLYTGNTVTGPDGLKYWEIRVVGDDNTSTFYYQSDADKASGATGNVSYTGPSSDYSTWTPVGGEASGATGDMTAEQLLALYGGSSGSNEQADKELAQQQAQFEAQLALSRWQAQQGSAMDAWDRAFQENQAAIERATNPLEIVPYLYITRGEEVPDWWKTAYQDLPSPWESPAWGESGGGKETGVKFNWAPSAADNSYQLPAGQINPQANMISAGFNPVNTPNMGSQIINAPYQNPLYKGNLYTSQNSKPWIWNNSMAQ